MDQAERALMPFTLRIICHAAICVAFVYLAIPIAVAQYTDRAAFDDLGGAQEFAQRRTALAKQLKTGYAVLFARDVIPEATHYREDNDFYYFTGIADPGAIMLLDVAKENTIIFEPIQDKQTAMVYGSNLLALPTAEREALGYKTVLPLQDFDLKLSELTGFDPGTDLWTRLGFPDKADGARMEVARDHAWLFAHPYYSAALPLDLAPGQLLAKRYPMAHVRDLTGAVDSMRNIKRPSEIAVLKRNGTLSAEGVRDAIAHARPGMYQYQIEALATFHFMNSGAQGVAYPAIVGSGKDINTWHYFSNRNRIEPTQLVVFDYAASLHHETMDITRTFNISGKFTPEQAKWYAVDLEAQKACINLLRPGHTYEEAVEAGKAVYEKNGIGKQWDSTYPFPGHFVGLATHDVLLPKGPVKVGQVVTVEPIIEFPDKQMHFRVEDTILVTENGPEILSSGVPKEMKEVEALVGSAH
jgi:Xaa-Pro aminopeptidase